MELQGRLSDLKAKGLALAAISYDTPEVLAKFSRERGITFPLLSDAGSATITAYGILNPLPEESLAGSGSDDPATKAQVQTFVSVVGVRPQMVGIALPGTFMLDRQGRVTSRFFEDFYIERSTAASVLMRVGAGPPIAGTRIAGPQLDVITYASDAAVAPGNRFALAVDIAPHSRMHVYAPGASGYRTVSLSLESQPFVRALPLKHPPSQPYLFKPLNERVPVYQRPFTLLQEVVLEGTPFAQAALRDVATLTLRGTLDYQTCDDAVCYTPASLPLSWTVTLRPILRP